MIAVIAFLLLTPGLTAQARPEVQVWKSSEDGRFQLTQVDGVAFSPSSADKSGVLAVDDSRTYQAILGMGGSLEPTTCFNLFQLRPDKREETVAALVSPTEGIGMNLMRICIGTPDFTGDPWYSYNDLPEGETDPGLDRFSIERDKDYILPILRLAKQKNPNLLFYASPWSPPGWMKSTGNMIGGYLLPDFYDSYARYFVKFIRAYQTEGVPIHAVTIQNEPGVDRNLESDPKWHYPSCRWTGEQERDFIKNHLGPAFEKEGIETEIWTYDHNYNLSPTSDGDDPGIDYPRTVLADPEAARFVDGVAFHGYAGVPAGMSVFHKEFPEVPLYFTEGSVYGARGAGKIIDLFRNRASSYNAWVLMIDENGKPNNGPFEADRTLVTRNSKTNTVEKHFDYFMYGHFMKFVQRGAVRIHSDGLAEAPNAAFKNPDGAIVAILANDSPKEKTVRLNWKGDQISISMEGNSVVTARW